MADRRTFAEMMGGVPLFAGLSRKEIESVLRLAREVTHQAGKEVVTEGREGVGFHLIVDGSATVNHGGRDIRTLGPGDSFGDIALIDGGPRSATVVAATAMRTLSIAAWDFKPLLIEHPQIAYKLMLQLCSRLREAEARDLT